MTQEELDALMNGGDFDSIDIEEEKPKSQEERDMELAKEILEQDPHDFKVSASMDWPPPPPSKEHQVVHQLDDVTKESERKASEIFDLLDAISNEAMNIEPYLKETLKILKSNAEIFEKLKEKFPRVPVFEDEYNKCKKSISVLNNSLDSLNVISDNILMTMDIMQYQDIHRQKIERVINVMRALSRYMNKLFEGKIDDTKRVSSAVHIVGDNTADVVNEDDIEALIASFGGGKS